MAAQTQPSPLLKWLYETDRGPLRRQPFKIDFGGRPLPTTLLDYLRMIWHYLRPEKTPGTLLARSSLLFDSPRSAQIVEQPTAGTDLYFGFFQHRKAIKYPLSKYSIRPGPAARPPFSETSTEPSMFLIAKAGGWGGGEEYDSGSNSRC